MRQARHPASSDLLYFLLFPLSSRLAYAVVEVWRCQVLPLLALTILARNIQHLEGIFKGIGNAGAVGYEAAGYDAHVHRLKDFLVARACFDGRYDVYQAARRQMGNPD